MLEIRLVEGAGSQNDRQRGFPLIGHPEHGIAQLPEEPGYPPSPQFTHRFGQHLLDDLAVFQGVPRAGGRLRAIAENPPPAVRCSGQICGVDGKPVAALRYDAVARPQKIRVAEHELRGHNAFGNEPLRPVEIGHQRVEYPRPLSQAAFDGAPLVGTHYEGQRIQRPGAIGTLRIRVDVVGNAVLYNQATRQLERPTRSPARILRRNRLDQRPPMRADFAVRIEQLVMTVHIGDVGRQAPLGQHGGPCSGHLLGCLRSSVKGNSALVSSGGAAILPGVRPILKKRARRRLSDSNALTGNVE